MKININYIDTQLNIEKESILNLEITNKKFFYRFINDLISLEDGNVLEEITAYNEDNEEINLSSKLEVISDFFDLNSYNKKYINDYNKYVLKKINDKSTEKISKKYNQLYDEIKKVLFDLDIPLIVKENNEIDSIIKNFKFEVVFNNDLLNNLFNLIDIKRTLTKDKIYIFVNLKSYLKQNELIEFYKYVLFNDIKIILVDSSSYNDKNNYTKKIIIDNELDEFVI